MSDLFDNRKQAILETVADLAEGLVVHDREEDEELPRGSIQEAIAAGEITADEIIAHFALRLWATLEDN
jgi:hypothetical protein